MEILLTFIHCAGLTVWHNPIIVQLYMILPCPIWSFNLRPYNLKLEAMSAQCSMGRICRNVDINLYNLNTAASYLSMTDAMLKQVVRLRIVMLI